MAFDIPGLSPQLTRRERDALRQKMAKERANAVIGHLCAITRLALSEGRILTPLAYEATFRQSIRSQLCLQGWKWEPADQVARELVGVVLNILQVKRPSWAEGQHEWTIEAGTMIERTRCVHCHKDLPEGHHKFCGKLCRTAHGLRMMRMREASEEQMAVMATRCDL